MFAIQVEGSVRNNFHVLFETKIGRLGRIKCKERPYVTQPSMMYRTELNLSKLNLNRLKWLETWAYHVVLFLLFPSIAHSLNNSIIWPLNESKWKTCAICDERLLNPISGIMQVLLLTLCFYINGTLKLHNGDFSKYFVIKRIFKVF